MGDVAVAVIVGVVFTVTATVCAELEHAPVVPTTV
jgi:hypothetical protein